MRIVQVPLGNRSYSIKVGDCLLPRLGAECAQLKLGRHCAVITDANVGRHYAKAAMKSHGKVWPDLWTATIILIPSPTTQCSIFDTTFQAGHER